MLFPPDSVVSKVFPEVGVVCEVKMFEVEVEDGVGIQLAAMSCEMKALFFWMFRRGRSFLPRKDCRG